MLHICIFLLWLVIIFMSLIGIPTTVVFLCRRIDDAIKGRKVVDISKVVRQTPFVVTIIDDYCHTRVTEMYSSQYRPCGGADFLADVSLRKQRAVRVFFKSDGTFNDNIIQRVNECYSILTIKSFRSSDFKTFLFSLFDNIINVPTSRSMNGMTPDEFFKKRETIVDNPVGCYVIHNLTKKMEYVGQATHLYSRVNQHFTGHGNGDVYADYKAGDNFLIELKSLVDSEYTDLDMYECALIEQYDAYRSGYNKNNGNVSAVNRKLNSV